MRIGWRGHEAGRFDTYAKVAFAKSEPVVGGGKAGTRGPQDAYHRGRDPQPSGGAVLRSARHPVMPVLTDRGTEFRGSESHDEDNHTRTKA